MNKTNPFKELSEHFPIGDKMDIEPAVYTKAKTNDEAEAAWKSGKDFQFYCVPGRYLSIRDTGLMREAGIEKVMIWTGARQGVEVKL